MMRTTIDILVGDLLFLLINEINFPNIHDITPRLTRTLG